MGAAVVPDDPEFRCPVRPLGDRSLHALQNTLAVVGMQELAEPLHPPIVLRDGFGEAETLIVAQRAARRVVNDVEIPVPDVRRLQRKVHRELRVAKRLGVHHPFGDVHDHTEHPLGLALLRSIDASSSDEPVDAAVWPDDAEFTGPVLQLGDRLSHAALDALPISFVHVPEELGHPPIALGDRRVVSKTLIVAQGTA